MLKTCFYCDFADFKTHSRSELKGVAICSVGEKWRFLPCDFECDKRNQFRPADEFKINKRFDLIKKNED